MKNTDSFLKFLQQISDDINKQFYTANYYQEFECVPVEVSEELVDLKYQEHEKKLKDARLAYRISKYLKEKFKEFSHEHDVSNLLNSTEAKDEFRSLVTKDLTLFLKKLEATNKLLEYPSPNINDILRFITDNFDQSIISLQKGEALLPQCQSYIERLEKEDELVLQRERFWEQTGIQFVDALCIVESKNFFSQSKFLLAGNFLDRINAKVGFCGEHAALALVRIINGLSSYINQIESITIKYLKDDFSMDDNHCFLVINRDKESKLNDITSWGESAILFDSWNKLVCKAKDYNSLPNRYVAYPPGLQCEGVWHCAEWTSESYVPEGEKTLKYIQYEDTYYQLTGNSDLKEREANIIDEYQLTSLQISKLANTKKFLFNILNDIESTHLANKVQMFITTTGDELISHISGLSSPAIAIHKNFLLGLEIGLYTIEEFKFSLIQGLLQATQWPIQLQKCMQVGDQHFIDWQALQIFWDGASAISYLQKAHQFEISPEADGNFKEYFNIFTKASPNFGERIKLLNTKLAKTNYKIISQSKRYDLQQMKNEINTIEKPAYFNDEKYAQFPTIVEKINFLKSKLPELKRELIPFEVTHYASVRLREYCQLLKKLQIDLSQQEQAEAIDGLLCSAFELKISGFDLIYKILSGNIERYAPLKTLGPFKKYQEAINAFVTANDSSTALHWAKKIQEYRKIFKTHFAWNLITEQNYVPSLPEKNERVFGSTIGNQVTWKSFQNNYKIRVTKELPKELSSNSYIFIDQPGKYELYFIDDTKKLLPIKLGKVKNLIEISHPKSKSNREFKIKQCIATFIFEHNKSLPWDNLVNWAKEDASNTIVDTLWLLGVMRDERLWYHLSIIDIANFVSKSHERYIEPLVYLDGEFVLFTEAGNYRQVTEALGFRMSKEHEINTQMFEKSLDFDTAFTHFYCVNRHALNWGPSKLNNESESVLFLIEKFTNIAKNGTKQEKEVVRSFFLGRKDQFDLEKLELRSLCYQIHPNSPYIKFFMDFCKPDHSFRLFTLDDFLKMTEKRYFLKCVAHVEYLLQVLQEPGEDLWHNISLVNLKDIITKITKHHLGQAFNVIKHYLKVNAKAPLLSHEAATIFELILKKVEFILPKKKKKVLNYFIGDLPTSADQEINISCKDLISIYQYFEIALSFPSFLHQEVLGKIILKKLHLIDDVDEQIKILKHIILQGKSSALSDVKFRDSVFHMYIGCILKKYGKDTNEEEKTKKFKEIINAIIKKVMERDATYLLSEMSNLIEAQDTVSTFIGKMVSPEKYFLVTKSYRQAENLIPLLSHLANNKESKLQVLNFLSCHLTQQTLDTFANFLIEKEQDQTFINIFMGRGGTHTKITLDWILQLFFNQFWSHNLEERSVLIDFLLIPAGEVIDEEKYKLAFNEAFDFVAKKLFPNVSANPLDNENFAIAFLKSYLNTADKYQRNYFLAGMLITTNEMASEKKTNFGRKLAKLCEHLGPAYVKLAQAIHSYPHTPAEIRKELEHVKGRANPPKRWDLWRLINNVLPSSELARIEKVGSLLGSASFNLALAVHLKDGSDVVLLLLRENAENDAKNGFEHLHAAINACQHERMEKMRSNALSLIQEANQLSFAEMQHTCGDMQDKIAQELYGSFKDIQVNGYKISLFPSKTLSSGHGYRFITRVYGTEYNDLPEQTQSDREIKKAIAKVIMQIELGNILRGDHFDCDRHGNQLRVIINLERKEISIGLYDFGEMSLTKPTNEHMQQLKDFLTRLLSNIFLRKDIATELSKYIENELKKGKPIEYLMRVRKGLLALQDFQKYLSSFEVFEIINTLVAQNQIHPFIKNELSKNSWLASGFFSFHKAKRTFDQTVGNFARFFSKRDEMDISTTESNNNSETVSKKFKHY